MSRKQYLETIEHFPQRLRVLVQGLSEAQLSTPYLRNEWTVAQNVHHVVDSHMNSYIRLKLILTEEKPPLKGYDQEAWAELSDYHLPIEISLQMLEGLHKRWVNVFRSLSDSQWTRVGIHSEIGEITPHDLARIYAEHCDAHIDQIQRTLAAQP
ncbi:MAG: putative metal-dependent hydrolase [Anaerolineae bacterium]|jgi:hypothetical protein|nr:MAG: putative metal-dependent hydrolase [Anaerolineae bacterium]MCL4878549.1 putative metal-dependent hydrolase [Anaerolineae bacterium]